MPAEPVHSIGTECPTPFASEKCTHSLFQLFEKLTRSNSWSNKCGNGWVTFNCLFGVDTKGAVRDPLFRKHTRLQSTSWPRFQRYRVWQNLLEKTNRRYGVWIPSASSDCGPTIKFPPLPTFQSTRSTPEKKHKEGETRNDRFFTIVTSMKTKRGVWANNSRRKEGLDAFYRLIGPKAYANIKVVAQEQHQGIFM